MNLQKMILCQKIKNEHCAVADMTQLSEANKNYTIYIYTVSVVSGVSVRGVSVRLG